MDICDTIARDCKRADLHEKLTEVLERALDNVEKGDYLASDWSNYENLVRQEFAVLAQEFAGWED